MFDGIKKILGLSYQSYQKKIPSSLNINLHQELPLESIREIVKFSSLVVEVNSWEEKLTDKPDTFFKERTKQLIDLIAKETVGSDEESVHKKIFSVMDKILPEAFAMVREAAKRTLGMRHFDVQILGGIVLHKGNIAEMTTGEGKTLVATLPAYLNALSGKGVHIVTVNDYLAKRDKEWMEPVYNFLGLSVGVIQSFMPAEERKVAYSCDITYGTNNEFGFDYLRDNMVISLEDMVQGEHFYAIVDEVDSILIDEARTPLIISGAAEDSTDKYYVAEKVSRNLKVRRILEKDEVDAKYKGIDLEKDVDYLADERNHSVTLTEEGLKKCEQLLGVDNLYEDIYVEWPHHLNQALRAKEFYKKDKDYIVKEGKVIIVDEFTGRLMPGRRWSDGLHQAIEAKEGLKIQQETQTFATITLQNYFKMYKKLSGMTGTAYTEAAEFKHIYNLGVVSIPTNKKLNRTYFPDQIYKNKKIKFDAVVKEIEQMAAIKRPVLVGTTSIENSEELSFLLKKKGINHNVLNAKYHEQEASIIAQAGRLGQVTIATNMAGRGTDIILGGNIDFFIKSIPEDQQRLESDYQQLVSKYREQFKKEQQEVLKMGGLHIVGTERHEARRIDNQLRGRSGRQGDPGSSRFYISLEDDLMRLFGSERISFIMERFNFPEDEPIEHYLINRSIEMAQRRVESHNFEIRKQLIEYDDVMNKQRTVVYTKRREILDSKLDKTEFLDMAEEVLDNILAINVESDIDYQTQLLSLVEAFKSKFSVAVNLEDIKDLTNDGLKEYFRQAISKAFYEKEEIFGADRFFHFQKMIYLQSLDTRWKEHLRALDEIKEGIHWQAYAQKNPLVEYQHKAYDLFVEMMNSVKDSAVSILFRIEPKETSLRARNVFSSQSQRLEHSNYSSLNKTKPQPQESKPKSQDMINKKVGRNDACPCGSGLKYKKCCGR